MDAKETYWHNEAPKYHWAHARLRLIADQIRADVGIRSVLDVGAGSGTLAHLLGRDTRYLGLDITGRKDADNAWPSIRFCDFDRAESVIAAIDGVYDAAVISGVLEYLQDWRGILRTVTEKTLRPGGLLLVSAIYDRFYETFPVKRHPAWRNRFVPDELRAALKDIDLRIDVTYPMWAGGSPWTVHLSRWAAFRATSRHPDWVHMMGVNQFLFVCRRKE
jgi:SAM-dependent methyltransferase